MLIHYLIDLEHQKFYFFQEGPEHYEAYKKKREEFIERIKTRKVIDDSKTLKKYHGTVWLRYQWKGTSVSYRIEGRYKDIKVPTKTNDKIKKFVIMTYEEYMKQFEEEETPLDDSNKGFRRTSPF